MLQLPYRELLAGLVSRFGVYLVPKRPSLPLTGNDSSIALCTIPVDLGRQIPNASPVVLLNSTLLADPKEETEDEENEEKEEEDENEARQGRELGKGKETHRGSTGNP